ncbi:hypothetical protein [Sulfurovum riftiae]|uniref:Uncharacterized protein n=1 Tax=Sulfurovum riftiae TaxID=1630136 RepID=A0A151CJK6_9BACT|nr:hypothetical protein [Sulfurovum riftiae]KYJ87728.1 hypothetical protein AS592_11605 [Sulfurovum riftiae]
MQDKQRQGGTSTRFSGPEKRIRSADGIGNSFAKQEVRLQDTPLFFPEGFEKIFLAIYFVSLPYILGLLFLFFYIAEGKFEVFLSVNRDSPFLMIWAIGYEILAVLIILAIIKSAISFTHNNSRKTNLDRLR